MVETDTLNNIIENSKFKRKNFDLLSIDIENHEYQALNFLQNSKIYKLLTKNNYKLINWIGSDLIFCRI